MELVEPKGSRWRIVGDIAPHRRRLFEALIPSDATDAEITEFADHIRNVVRKRRQTQPPPIR